MTTITEPPRVTKHAEQPFVSSVLTRHQDPKWNGVQDPMHGSPKRLSKTRSSAAFTADIEGGLQLENVRFTFNVRGSDGWLSLTSNHPYGFQAGDLKLTSSVPFAEPDAAAVSGTVEAINVGEVYAELVRDLHNGTYKTPGFQHALHNARLIEAVMHSADQGVAGFTPFAR
jgi:predicted dehydrogenase